MAEKPILFSGAMVRAILEGRKSQTRRVVKPNKFVPDVSAIEQFVPGPYDDVWTGFVSEEGCNCGEPCLPIGAVTVPYSVGDILWVKETWQPNPEAGSSYPEGKVSSDSICYAADFSSQDYEDSKPWKPSLFMPHDAARIFLRVTNVRVERLQDISESDAEAESCYQDYCGGGWRGESAKSKFQKLWDSINAKKHPWESNPWVWVYEFEQVTK